MAIVLKYATTAASMYAKAIPKKNSYYFLPGSFPFLKINPI
jgi:hypothetical protein